MANGRNNPNNPAVAKQAPAPDPQPWNRSTMEIEPSPAVDPQITPQGRYNDRIKLSPMNEETGAATKRALKGWPEGVKKT